tara:strand:- start:358 stop:690 length:333 start_codon:yes stop_codon:yes gene_type:complete
LSATNGFCQAAFIIVDRKAKPVAIVAILRVVATAILFCVDRSPIAGLRICASRKFKRVTYAVHVFVAETISVAVEAKHGVFTSAVVFRRLGIIVARLGIGAPRHQTMGSQ